MRSSRPPGLVVRLRAPEVEGRFGGGVQASDELPIAAGMGILGLRQRLLIALVPGILGEEDGKFTHRTLRGETSSP